MENVEERAEELLKEMQEEITKKEEKLEDSVVENQQLREHTNGPFERETAIHGKHVSQ